jgi:uncharacterized membrane protein YkvA (DUF1232 family)
MKLYQRTKNGIKSILTHGFTLIYIFKDKRVPWRIKLILLISILYILTPLDVVPDSLVVIGHLDDLITARIIFYVIKKFVKPEIISDNTERANYILLSHKEQKLKYLLMISIVWIGVITFAAIYFIKKIYFKKSN